MFLFKLIYYPLIRAIILIFLISLSIPTNLYSQNNAHTDTLFMKTGVIHPCSILKINNEGQFLEVLYKNNKFAPASIDLIEKIYFHDQGIIFKSNDGYLVDYNSLSFKKVILKSDSLTNQISQGNQRFVNQYFRTYQIDFSAFVFSYAYNFLIDVDAIRYNNIGLGIRIGLNGYTMANIGGGSKSRSSINALFRTTAENENHVIEFYFGSGKLLRNDYTQGKSAIIIGLDYKLKLYRDYFGIIFKLTSPLGIGLYISS